MADPLSLLKKQKGDDKPARTSTAPAPTGTGKTTSLFDVEASLGGSSRSTKVEKSSLFDVHSSLGSPSTSLGNGAPLSVADRIQQALAPASNVDFPMVTEICDAIAKEPSSLPEAVRLLCSGFESRSPPRRKLKALTIIHELMYDQRAPAELKKVPGARDALWELQKVTGSGLGVSADEQIRMFATEVEKTCYGSSGDPFAPISSDDPFSPTFLPTAQEQSVPSVMSPVSPQGTSTPISSLEPRQRKRDQAMDKLWEFGSLVKDNLVVASDVAKKNFEAAKVQLGGESSRRPENIPKLAMNLDTARPTLNIQFDGMLEGEQVHLSVTKMYLLTSNPFCETPGRLLGTNYRLKFQAQKGSLREELAWLQERQVLDVPLGLIEEAKLENPQSEAGVSQWKLRLVTKDCRNLVFLVADANDLAVVEEHVQALSQPGEHFTSALFAFRHAQALGGNQSMGWDIYDPVVEFSRMGVDTDASPSASSPWYLDTSNHSYGICSTYPAMLPTDGILNTANIADENLVKAIRRGKGSGGGSALLTVDLRSKKAAMANKVGGGGFETYSDCRVLFGNIDNVHGVREAWRKMGKAVASLSCSEVGSWFKDVANSGWYDIMGAVLFCTCTVIEELEARQSNALIHCSDGWDRTAQVSALTMLCMDPEYRTVRGLCVLIQKEFCAFGHRFRTRLANGEKPTSEYSPIFIQWLECVYQLTVQFPEAFEFSPALLLFIGREALTNRYGTFLTDSEKERTEVAKRTCSLWHTILHAGPSGPTREHVNSDYRRSTSVLRPSPTQVNFKIWEEYWFRFQVHPRNERR